jgi:hypothetical protein
MNEIQKIVRRAIEEVKTTNPAYQQKKWRNKVVDRLEEVEALASKVPNPEHPHNQPLPEPDGRCNPPIDDDVPINLDDIDF